MNMDGRGRGGEVRGRGRDEKRGRRGVGKRGRVGGEWVWRGSRGVGKDVEGRE